MAAVIINGKRLKVVFLRSKTRQGYLLSPILYNIVLEVLAKVIIKEREIEGI